MEIREIMTSGCTYVSPSTSLIEAAQKMLAEDIGVLPVAENDRLVGMVTDRDIVIRGIAAGMDTTTAILADVMSGDVYYCYEDQLCDEVAKNMAELQVRRLPVVDRHKKLVGIISLGDMASKGAPAKAKKALEGISQ